MTSLGNDIVALSAINAERTNQESFYKKILAASEINFFHERLHELLSFENYLWLTWTIKESSFKCLQRHSPELIFSPRNIIVEQVVLTDKPVLTLSNQHFSGFNRYANCSCLVSTGGKSLFGRSIISNEWIYSIVSDENDFESIHWGIQQINFSDYEHQHTEARKFIHQKLADIFPSGENAIIKTKTGFPIILNNDRQQDIILSLTHHEKFTAYAFT